MQATATGPRILVTAFEPFAPPGGAMRASNASEEVLRACRTLQPGFDFLVLPVEARCEVDLARAFDRDPAGVVAMGETGQAGAWDTNVEEFARDLPIGRTRPGAAFRSSLFASNLALLPGMERQDRIGDYWCNRAYYRVLEWCQLFHRPAVFLHLRVEGDRRRQLRHLQHTLVAMEDGIRRPRRERAALVPFSVENR